MEISGVLGGRVQPINQKKSSAIQPGRISYAGKLPIIKERGG
jgi:hypothetical protein